MTQNSLGTLRHYFAGEMLRLADVASDERLKAAFATVKREDFLGPPPWLANDFRQYDKMPTDDPAVLYQDVLVALDPARGINNGSPALHARGIHALSPRPGETVVHIGAGTGYYSAILAEMVAPGGRVIAVEYDPDLAARARRCLEAWDNVEVVCGNGADYPQAPADIVYVNFAIDRPADAWVEQLKPGGRLLFPLGVPADVAARAGSDFSDMAGYLLVVRENKGFAARFLLGVSFIWGEGMARGSGQAHDSLRAAFRGRGARKVKSLRWKTQRMGEEWYSEPDWGLSTLPPGG